MVANFFGIKKFLVHYECEDIVHVQKCTILLQPDSGCVEVFSAVIHRYCLQRAKGPSRTSRHDVCNDTCTTKIGGCSFIYLHTKRRWNFILKRIFFQQELPAIQYRMHVVINYNVLQNIHIFNDHADLLGLQTICVCVVESGFIGKFKNDTLGSYMWLLFINY